jgi:hypothetical protein
MPNPRASRACSACGANMYGTRPLLDLQAARQHAPLPAPLPANAPEPAPAIGAGPTPVPAAPRRIPPLPLAVGGAALAVALLSLACIALFGLGGSARRSAAPAPLPAPTAPASVTPALDQAATTAALALVEARAAQARTAAALGLRATIQVQARTATAAAQVAAESVAQTAIAEVWILARAIEPGEIFTGTLPLKFTVRGSNLDFVNAAALLAADGASIPLVIESATSDLLALRLDALPAPLNGAATYALQLNGAQRSLALTLRDYSERKAVRGARPEYGYTGRVEADNAGPFAAMRVAPDAAGPPAGALRNDDQVDILRADVPGWYMLRVSAAADPARVGGVGWIERWLVDDAEVPPPPASATPIPQPVQRRTFVAEVIRSFPGSGQSGRRDSCLAGRVVNRRNVGIANALLYANNGATNTARFATNRNGDFYYCGLGDSNWSVVLTYIPGQARLARQVVAVVYVNGSREHEAVIHFRER